MIQKAVAFSLLTFSLSSFACLNLNGTYLCKSKFVNMPDTQETISMYQDGQGTFIYKIEEKELPNGETETLEFITDGKKYPIQDPSNPNVKANYTSSCTSTHFIVTVDGTDSEIGSFNLKLTRQLESKNIKRKIQGKTDKYGPFNYTENCTRL